MTRTCARDLTDRIKAAAADVAELLHRAHEGRAWSALGYPSWAEYCKAEFEMSPRHSYRLLDFVEIKNELAKSDPWVTPENERQTRPLSKLEPEQRSAAWRLALQRAGGQPLDAKQVEQTAEEVSRPEKKPEISDELWDEIRDTIAAALSQAWEKLLVIPEMDWQLFRSGVRGWLKSK